MSSSKNDKPERKKISRHEETLAIDRCLRELDKLSDPVARSRVASYVAGVTSGGLKTGPHDVVSNGIGGSPQLSFGG